MCVLHCVWLFCDPMDSSLPGSCPWNFSSMNIGMGCHVLLQEIFPTQIKPTSLASLAFSRVFFTTSTLATSCEELTHWKRLWCWEGLGAGGEREDRGWDGWMASLTQWTWVWVNSGSWWGTGRPGLLRFMGSQRVGHDWATDLIWVLTGKPSHWHSCI